MAKPAREFEDIDWQCWGSSEPWNETDKPVMIDIEHWTIVGDKNGFTAVSDDEDVLGLDIEVPTQRWAFLLLNSFPKDADIDYFLGLGFTR